jgi:ribosomal 30S subunit maturation factor RimM
MEDLELANMKNFWITKSKEKNILKVVEWAHKNNKAVLSLEIYEVIDALKSYIRESLHS